MVVSMLKRPNRRRAGLGVVVVLALMVAAILPVLALPGSTFESSDGNLVVDTSGNKDWSNAPNLAFKHDASARLGESDDSYKGGAKHDDICPEASTGSIPPEKDDLLELYVGHETVGDDIFLYLGWERLLSKDSSASAHMGFEFNKNSTACAAATKSKNVERSAGDMLIIYDLEGGGQPTLLLNKWLTTLGPGDTCKSAASAPCWGNEVNLSAAGFADGEINRSAPIDEPLSQRFDSLDFRHMFGEAAINLTDAGVFEEGQCEAFGSALLASRSSGNSFTSTLKDFVGPLPVNITNCGSLKIIKKDSNGNNLAGAKFKVYKDDGDGVFEPGAGDVQVGSECTTTSDGTGNCIFQNLPIGDKFWVEETQVPPGYTGEGPKLIEITSTAQHTITFVNTPAVGDLTITKTDDAGNPLAGVKFTLKGTSTIGNTVDLFCVTNASGVCSFTGVPVGTYTLDEDASTLPPGYSKDPAFPQSVTITSGGTATVTATNPRLHRVVVIVCHEGTDTLFSSNVVNGTSTKASIGSVPAALSAKGVTQKDLCDIGGASFGGLPHGNKSVTAQIGSH